MHGDKKSRANEGTVGAKGSSLGGHMRALRICMLALLAVLVVVPLALMNHDPDGVSESENRRLQTFPSFSLGTLASGDSATQFFSEISSYVSDRIGFRDEMIGSYSVLNDSLFNVMTHPLYEYGEDGYVFFRFENTVLDQDYITAFADYVLEMQEYCEARGIEFLYVISPEKARVYEEYIPEYVSEIAFSTDLLIPLLEERGVNYIDQGEALFEAKATGSQVFNVVYDAGHWNTEGMYAGSQAVIDALQELGVNVDDIDVSAYEKVYEEQTSLPASNYPIWETTCKYEIMSDAANAAQRNDDFNSGLVLNEIYRTAHYYTSTQEEDCSVLMFQGSYYNTQGTMLQNQFSTLATVHDYGNVFNLPYYVGVYQPDVVIFENADYTVSNSYYAHESLLSTRLPSLLSLYDDWAIVDCGAFASFEREEGVSISSFYYSWPEDLEGIDYSYVIADGFVYEAAGQSDGRYLWGALSSALDEVDEVTMVGIDLDADVRYQGICRVVA